MFSSVSDVVEPRQVKRMDGVGRGAEPPLAVLVGVLMWHDQELFIYTVSVVNRKHLESLPWRGGVRAQTCGPLEKGARFGPEQQRLLRTRPGVDTAAAGSSPPCPAASLRAKGPLTQPSPPHVRVDAWGLRRRRRGTCLRLCFHQRQGQRLLPVET